MDRVKSPDIMTHQKIDETIKVATISVESTLEKEKEKEDTPKIV